MSEMERTPADAPAVRVSRNRAMWVAALVLLLVGAAGVATGIALERRVLSRHGEMRRGPRGEFGRGGRGGRPADTLEARKRFRERMIADLDLTPQQAARIDTIMERQRPHMDSLRAVLEPQLRAAAEATRRQIEAVLTPEQVQKFRARAPGGPGDRRGRGGGPPF